MRRYMGTDEDRERVKTLLNKEAVGWRKERLVALKMGFQPHHTIDEIGVVRLKPHVCRGALCYSRLGRFFCIHNPSYLCRLNRNGISPRCGSL